MPVRCLYWHFGYKAYSRSLSYIIIMNWMRKFYFTYFFNVLLCFAYPRIRAPLPPLMRRRQPKLAWTPHLFVDNEYATVCTSDVDSGY